MYDGDFMVEIKENVELNKQVKQKFKIIAAQQGVTMKDLLLHEAKEIMEYDYYVPTREREAVEDRSSLIVNIPSEFKEEIRLFIQDKDIKIRDLWVESVDRVIERHKYV